MSIFRRQKKKPVVVVVADVEAPTEEETLETKARPQTLQALEQAKMETLELERRLENILSMVAGRPIQ